MSKSFVAGQSLLPRTLISNPKVQKVNQKVLWFNPSQQLSTMQPLTHFPPPPVGWGRKSGKEVKPAG